MKFLTTKDTKKLGLNHKAHEAREGDRKEFVIFVIFVAFVVRNIYVV